MNYKINDSLYIRHEMVNGENAYFFFVGEEDRMFQLNESAYDCFVSLETGANAQTVAHMLKSKYTMSSEDEILLFVESTIQFFLDNKIIYSN